VKRLLLDQGLAPRAAVILRADGFDALHVVEVGLECADDLLILETARAEGRVCVTLDHDFHSYLAMSGAGRQSSSYAENV
jgi:predicted nuclease of predicted toxin-antitoxin system